MLIDEERDVREGLTRPWILVKLLPYLETAGGPGRLRAPTASLAEGRLLVDYPKLRFYNASNY